MPAPTAGVRPLVGAFALLLSMIRLFAMTVQDLVAERGQRPSCGGGASSLLREFGARPVRLSANIDRVMTSRPPALVPE